MTVQEQNLTPTSSVSLSEQIRRRKATTPTATTSKTGLGLALAVLGGVAGLATLASTSGRSADADLENEELESGERRVVIPEGSVGVITPEPVVFEEPDEASFLSVSTDEEDKPYYMSHDEWLEFLERGISQEQIERWDQEYPDQDVKAYVLPLVPTISTPHYFKGPAFINVKKAERVIQPNHLSLSDPLYFRLADTIVCVSRSKNSRSLYLHHPFEPMVQGEGYFDTPGQLADLLKRFDYSIEDQNLATAQAVFEALPAGYIAVPFSMEVGKSQWAAVLIDPERLPTGALTISPDNTVASDPIYIRFTNEHGTERTACISIGRGGNYRQGLYAYDVLTPDDRPQGWWKSSQELAEILECSQQVAAGIIDILPEKHTVNRIINLVTSSLNT